MVTALYSTVNSILPIISDTNEVIRYLSTNWPVFVCVITAAGFIFARFRFGVSVFQPLEEISYRQQAYKKEGKSEDFRKRMVQRHLSLGNQLITDFHLPAAREEFEYALGIDPVNTEAQFGLLKTRVFEPIADNDYDPDISARKIEQILDESPNDEHAKLFLGVLHMRLGTEQERTIARKFFREALDLDSKCTLAYINLGWIADVEGDPVQACEFYRKANEASPFNLTALNNLAYHLLRLGEYAESAEKSEEIVAINKNQLISYWNLSNALRLIGKLAEAERVLATARGLFSEEEVWKLKRNSVNWFFQTHDDGTGVLFETIDEKRCYTSYSLGATRLMLNDEDGARQVLSGIQHGACGRKALEFLAYQCTLCCRAHPEVEDPSQRLVKLLESISRPSLPLGDRGRDHRVKAKPANAGRSASLDTAATTKSGQLRGGRAILTLKRQRALGGHDKQVRRLSD